LSSTYLPSERQSLARVGVVCVKVSARDGQRVALEPIDAEERMVEVRHEAEDA